MERFKIGHTRSGKLITSHTDLDALDAYTELFDAMAVMSVLALVESKRDRGSELAMHLRNELNKLVSRLKRNEQLDEQMVAVGAKTSIDVAHYARRLLLPEFKE